MTTFENKSVVFGVPRQIAEVKAAGDTWEVSGYVSTWDVDLGNDQIRKGAFTKSLAGGHRVRFLYQHDHRQVIGTAEELREDEKGLFGRFRISRTALGADVHTLLKDGALDSFSIGYLPEDFEIDKKSGIRSLNEISLLECSVVALPMNPAALVTGVKELDGNSIAQAVAEYVRTAETKRAARPLEEILEEAHAEVKALWARRLADGREPSAKNVAAVEAYRTGLLEEADRLLALLPTETPATETADAPVVPEPEAKAQPETDAQPEEPEAKAGAASAAIERERDKRRLLRKFGGVVVPVPDPIAGFERLPARDPLTGEVVS